MRHLLVATAALALAPALVQAATFDPNDIGLNCTSGLSMASGDQMVLLCKGSLSLSGARSNAGLIAGESITLQAGGDISLEHVRLTAPQITLISTNGGVMLRDNAILNASQTDSTAMPSVVIRSGAVTTVPPLTYVPAFGAIHSSLAMYSASSVSILATRAVPEPGTWALLLAGLGTVGLLGRRRAA